jgi:hypothetical protein
MEQAHSLETHSAPQQSDDEEHGAPLTHFDVASVLILAMPNRADMNDDVVFCSTSRTTWKADDTGERFAPCNAVLHTSLTIGAQ